jgi:hypothetical protein
MDKAELTRRLADLLALEARSLLAYLAFEADPVLDQSSAGARNLLQEVSGTTRRHVEKLTSRVGEEGGRTEVGPYPFAYMRYNYLTADHLLPDVGRDLDRVARGLEGGAAAFAGLRADLGALLGELATTRRREKSEVDRYLAERSAARAS